MKPDTKAALVATLILLVILLLIVFTVWWARRPPGPGHIRLEQVPGGRTARAFVGGAPVGPLWQVSWDPVPNILKGVTVTFTYTVKETQQAGSTTSNFFVLTPLLYDTPLTVTVYAAVPGAQSDTISATLGPIVAPPQISTPSPYSWSTMGGGFIQFTLDPPTSQAPDLAQFQADAQNNVVAAVVKGQTGTGTLLQWQGNIVSAGNTWHVFVGFGQTIASGDTVNITDMHLVWGKWGAGNSLAFTFVMPPGDPQNLQASQVS